jgi:hypothetical protein
VELHRAYHAEEFSDEGDFSERLSTFSKRLGEKYQAKYGKQDARRLTANEVTELIYTHNIKELRTLISNYLQRKESVWVLFDNLDKGGAHKGSM